MTKIGNLEIRTYELECVSPVHIGNGETLRPFEYLYDSYKRCVYFINQTKWVQFLERHQLMDDFAKRLMGIVVTKQNTEDSLWDWLLKRGIHEEELKELGERTAQAETVELMAGEKKSLNEIHVQMATAEGRPFIPGSAIKGALRTAILYHLIQVNPKSYQLFWNDFENAIYSNNQKYYKQLENGKTLLVKLDSICKNLGKKAFSVMGLKKNERNGKEKVATPEANSILRGLRISDAVCVDPKIDTVVLQKVDATTYGDRENNISLYRECIPAGARLRFTVTTDKAFLNKIGISSFDDILNMSRSFLQDGLALQKEVFGSRYPRELEEAFTADMLLGGGTGFFSKTVFYCLAPNEKQARELLKIYFDKRSKHDHQKHDTDITPRTLKLTRTETDKSLMGLCRIQEVPEC